MNLQEVEALARRIAKFFKAPCALHGSFATGCHASYSDVDLLIFCAPDFSKLLSLKSHIKVNLDPIFADETLLFHDQCFCIPPAWFLEFQKYHKSFGEFPELEKPKKRVLKAHATFLLHTCFLPVRIMQTPRSCFFSLAGLERAKHGIRGKLLGSLRDIAERKPEILELFENRERISRQDVIMAHELVKNFGLKIKPRRKGEIATFHFGSIARGENTEASDKDVLKVYWDIQARELDEISKLKAEGFFGFFYTIYELKVVEWPKIKRFGAVSSASMIFDLELVEGEEIKIKSPSERDLEKQAPLEIVDEWVQTPRLFFQEDFERKLIKKAFFVERNHIFLEKGILLTSYREIAQNSDRRELKELVRARKTGISLGHVYKAWKVIKERANHWLEII